MIHHYRLTLARRSDTDARAIELAFAGLEAEAVARDEAKYGPLRRVDCSLAWNVLDGWVYEADYASLDDDKEVAVS